MISRCWNVHSTDKHLSIFISVNDWSYQLYRIQVGSICVIFYFIYTKQSDIGYLDVLYSYLQGILVIEYCYKQFQYWSIIWSTFSDGQTVYVQSWNADICHMCLCLCVCILYLFCIFINIWTIFMNI